MADQKVLYILYILYIVRAPYICSREMIEYLGSCKNAYMY